MAISLVSDGAVLGSAVAAIGGLAAEIGVLWRRGGRLCITIPVACGVVLAAGLGAALRVANPFHSTWPLSFGVWTAVALVAVSLVPAAWPRFRLLGRGLVAVVAVLGLAFAAIQVNAHYRYIPDVTALLGRQAHDIARLPDLPRRVEAAKSAAPPSTGTVVEVDIPGAVSHFVGRSAFVYLPPAWFAPVRPSLPVLMLLDGSPGTTADWTRSAGADLIADAYASSHGGMAPVLVMPDPNGGLVNDTQCVDTPSSRPDTYLAVDVTAFVRSHLGVPVTAPWAVGGLSEGGTCAVDLTVRHPDTFSLFLDFGGDVAPTLGSRKTTRRMLFGDSAAAAAAYDPARAFRMHMYPGHAGWFEDGTGDRTATAAAQTLAPLAARAGLDVCLVSRPGSHDFGVWHQALQDALPAVMGLAGLGVGDWGSDCVRAGGTTLPKPAQVVASTTNPTLVRRAAIPGRQR